jgi:hypothetical protein
MPNVVKWQTGNLRALVENGSLNAGESITVPLDNATNKDRYADFQLTVNHDVAPAIGGVFTLWANPRVLGSATDDTLGTPVGSFPINNATGTQTSITVKGVMLSPAMTDITLRNDTNQNAAIGSVQLSALTYNEEIQ